VGSKLASRIFLQAWLSVGLAFCRLVSAALAAGLRVTQMVDGDKGMHAALDKKYLARKAKWD
jgi:hypothetical protein